MNDSIQEDEIPLFLPFDGRISITSSSSCEDGSAYLGYHRCKSCQRASHYEKKHGNGRLSLRDINFLADERKRDRLSDEQLPAEWTMSMKGERYCKNCI